MAHGAKIDRRKINKRNHIIDLFRQNGPLSKAQARELSRYSMDTIISIFDSLIEEGLIVIAVGEQKKKGRRAQFYDLNHKRRLYLGTMFNDSGIFSSVVSFSRREVEQSTTRLPSSVGKDEFIELFTSHIESIVSNYSGPDGGIAAVGCSVPGDIDHEAGILKSYTFIPSLANVNFIDLISKTAPEKRIVADHNVRSMIEYILNNGGAAEERETVLFVSARSGAASGLIHKGRVVTDRGEFGHIKVTDEKARCICGRSGCLDCYFSLNSFIKIAPEMIEDDGNAKDTALLDRLAGEYRNGSGEIKRELDRRLKLFTIALLNVINVTVPDLVILTGELFKIYGDPIKRIKEITAEHFEDGGYISHFRNADFDYLDIGPEIAAIGICHRLIGEEWRFHEEER
ncbi:MAG: ROK family protein [Deltaproteobacteria bacterium]|uniref:ROK family protein n=1 Tax=Candidatus Zymogenus saltonus TaxID=2844893 RepID=A0A9D8KGT8_9DELT|nr:ROK family protein [Candidatus Zymogenus saltonus]